MDSENKVSVCHGASVTVEDGKATCNVCARECEVKDQEGSDSAASTENTGTGAAGDQGSGDSAALAEGQAAAALNPGEACTLSDGSEGIVAPDGVCVPKAAEGPKAGDPCELPEGGMGVLALQGEALVCIVEEQKVDTENGIATE